MIRSAPTIVLWLSMLAAAASVRADERPRLANEREVLEAVMRPMLMTGLVADGTTFAAIRIGADGRATPTAFYGAVYAASDPLARLVWQATTAARFDTPGAARANGSASGGANAGASDGDASSTAAATRERDWAIFWVFQTNACRPWTYDAPRDATVIRVCIDVKAGGIDTTSSYYVVDALPSPRLGPEALVTLGPPRPLPYPDGPWTRGEAGDLTLRVTVDDTGKVVRTEPLDSHGGPAFADWFAEWQRGWQVQVPPNFVPPGGTRTFTVQAALAVARPGARECIYVMPDFQGPGVAMRMCTESRSRRP